MAVGGTFRRLTGSYVGPAAVRCTRDVFADRFFGSVTGVTAGGVLTDADGLEAEVKRTMLHQAEQSVLLLDESKLSAHGRHAVAPISALSLVLADGLETGEAEALVASGAALQLIDPPATGTSGDSRRTRTRFIRPDPFPASPSDA